MLVKILTLRLGCSGSWWKLLLDIRQRLIMPVGAGVIEHTLSVCRRDRSSERMIDGNTHTHLLLVKWMRIRYLLTW